MANWISVNDSLVNQHNQYCSNIVLINIIPEPSYFSFIYGLTITIGVLEILGFIYFAFHQKSFLILKARPLYMSFLMTCACTMYNFFLMSLETNGRHMVSCSAFYVIQYLSVAISITILPIRLNLYLFRLVQMKLLVQKTQMEREGKEVDLRQPTLSDCIRALLKSKDGIIQVDFEPKDGHQQHVSSPKATRTIPAASVSLEKDPSVASPTPTHSSSQGIMLVTALREKLAPAYLILFMIFPCFIVLLGRLLSYDPVLHGCYGCEFQLLDVFLVGGSGVVSLILSSVVSYSARNEPDPLQTKFEVNVVSSLASTAGILPYPLLFLYPLPHYTYKFNYHLLVNLALFFNQMVTTFGIVWLAKKMRYDATKKKTMFNIDVIVKNDITYNLFLKHCVGELSAENLLFYKDILKWKAEWDDASPAYIKARAEVIYNMYLSVKSSFEVNISGTQRENLRRAIKQPDPKVISGQEKFPKDMFDFAILEIKLLLSHDSLPRFLASKSFKEKVLSTNLSDQLQVESAQLSSGKNITLMISPSYGHKTAPME